MQQNSSCRLCGEMRQLMQQIGTKDKAQMGGKGDPLGIVQEIKI